MSAELQRADGRKRAHYVGFLHVKGQGSLFRLLHVPCVPNLRVRYVVLVGTSSKSGFCVGGIRDGGGPFPLSVSVGSYLGSLAQKY